jgi:hypothetical protein
MPETYEAVLQGDHIEWGSEIPRQAESNEKINVLIIIPGSSGPTSTGQASEPDPGLRADETLFQQLAERWRSETEYISSLSKMVLHPAYQRIIGLGKPAVPLILSELQKQVDHWLWALHAITGESPAPPNATFREAAQAWLDWGREKGYLG